MENKKKQEWIVTYMWDYPYSATLTVEGETEKEAWEDFEKKHGYPRNEYCSIKKIM